LVSSLSLIFPAYNEEKNLPRLLETVREIVPIFVSNFEAIVVNDGSKNGTFEILEEYKSKCSWLKVIHHEANIGYGAAVKDGLLNASKEFIFFTDADLQFELYSLGAILPYLRHYKVVLGYRAPRVDPWARKLNAWLWRTLVTALFGIKVYDIDCAFKAFHREVLAIVQQIESKGAMFSTELLVRLRLNGYKWVEVPVRHLPRAAGVQTGANLKVIFKAFKELFEFHRCYRRGEI